MAIVPVIQSAVSAQIKQLYQVDLEPASITVSETKPEFEGDYTVVLFALLKTLKKKPEELGNELGQALVAGNAALFSGFNVIKGFLNLTVSDSWWLQFLKEQYNNADYGRQPHNGQRVMVEYSSPNTNKPLHLGHLRNNFLGWSVAEIYKANGYEVVKTCIANDRGIHICKSMIAWQRFGNGATPESTGIKGDHLVGDYYVMFGNVLKEQMKPILEKKMAELITEGKTEKEAVKYLEDKKAELEKEAEIMQAAQQMLVDWEAGKPDVVELWRTMNSWVYKGFDETYKNIGSDFDKTYYESETYLLGKDLVEQGLEKKVFFLKDDGSAWVDLTGDGLDQKIVRRRDGTAVYITQDIGLAQEKQKEFHCTRSIYVVGDEQNYHFKVLKLICQKLGIEGADGIYHLSYGMVELPTGRMKTREGTVVDADDIMDEMIREAKTKREEKEQNKTDGLNAEGLNDLDEIIGTGAIKFFLVRVDPKKRMIFNPEESIDLHGFTATAVQYTYARTQALLRKEMYTGGEVGADLLPLEKQMIITLERYADVIRQAGEEMSPSVIAGYVYEVAKLYNTFYHEHSILQAESAVKKELRLQVNQMAAHVIKSGMSLLGIRVPDRM